MTSTSAQQGLSLRRNASESTPWLAAFLVITIPAIPSTAVFPGPLKGNGSPARLIGYACLALVAITFVANRRRTKGVGVNPGTIILLLFFLLQLLTYATGLLDLKNATIEANKTRTLLVFCAYVGVGLYALQTLKTDRQRYIVTGCLIAGLTYCSVIGLLQAYLGMDYRMLLVPPGFTESLDQAGFANRLGAARVVGTSRHAIEFSILAATLVPLSIHMFRFASRPYLRQLSALCCIIGFAAVPTAVSRSGLVALSSLLIYMLAWKLRALANAVFLTSIILGAYAAVSPGYLRALWNTVVTSQDDKSISTRTDDYATVGQTFREHPWFGLGLGGNPPDEYGFLDNQWLQAIVQGGIVGVSAMSILAVGVVVGITAALRNAVTEAQRNYVYAIGSATLGILFSSVTFDLFAFQQATLIFFLLYGVLWSQVYTLKKTRHPTILSPRSNSIL